MTCIVGLVDNGSVYMGADSAGADGYDILSTKLPKVFILGEFMIGFTSSFRMGQLIQYMLQIPSRPDDITDEEYIIRYIIEDVRKCLMGGGYTKKSDNRELSGSWLCGYNGRLYRVGPEFQIIENILGYDAIGCGGTIALGALYAGEGTPHDKILCALSAAQELSAGVRSPFTILTLPPKG